MKSDEQEFKEVATKVRNWALSHRMERSELYGWCTTCSKKIFEVLQESGFQPIFCRIHKNSYCISGTAHCFVLCNDYLIDCTASQFGQEEVFVKKNSEVEKLWFWDWKRADKFSTMEEIKMEMFCWDDDCNPFHLEAEHYLLDFKTFIPQINFEKNLF